jgi:hypothetical protein
VFIFAAVAEEEEGNVGREDPDDDDEGEDTEKADEEDEEDEDTEDEDVEESGEEEGAVPVDGGDEEEAAVWFSNALCVCLHAASVR